MSNPRRISGITFLVLWSIFLVLPFGLSYISRGVAVASGVCLAACWVIFMPKTCMSGAGPFGLILVMVQIAAGFQWLLVGLKILKGF